MRLYTTTGDGGETSLRDGARVPKNDVRVLAIGALDELNAVLGWCRSAAGGQAVASRIEAVQRELFILGAELVTSSDSKASRADPTLRRRLPRGLQRGRGV